MPNPTLGYIVLARGIAQHEEATEAMIGVLCSPSARRAATMFPSRDAAIRAVALTMEYRAGQQLDPVEYSIQRLQARASGS